MNESPWQPPTDGELGPQPIPADPPTGSPAPPPPSPWSPEGVAASTTGAPDLPPPAPTAAPAPGSDPDAAPPAEPRRRRSRLVVAGIVAAVAALGLAGLFAVQRFGDESAGGAGTPDELAMDLLAAIEAEDVLGMIDTLLPGERDSLGDPFVDLVGELQRLEILSDDTDLSHLLGLDVELTRETVDVRATNVPDIVNVALSAEATVTVDGATLPLGAFVEEQLPEDALAELRDARVTETDELAFEMTAVQDGDRWYFSVFHTIAELARAEAGDEPIPVDGVAADGADTPEGAVDQLLDHVEQLNLRGIIATLDPAEAAALQRYAPLFLDDAEAVLADVPVDWTIDVREFRVDGDGGERTVFLDAIGVSGEAEGQPFTFEFSDGCVRAQFDGESIEQCGTDPQEELSGMLADAPSIEAFIESLQEAFSDVEPIGFELRERDGQWFVSPLATGTEAMLTVIRALDRGELDTLVADGTAAVAEFVDVFLFGFDDEFTIGSEIELGDDPFGEDEVVVEDGDAGDEAATGDDAAIGEDPDGDVDEGRADPQLTAWDACYEEAVAADAIACFDRYVESGEIERLAVPAPLLFPECGLAEMTWEGHLYSATDAEFVAALEVAVPCFQALVDSGAIEEWMVPFEVAFADCFEDRNWYTEFDDDEYNARVDDCIAAR